MYKRQSDISLNQERAAKLELERQRLQLTLREAKLLSVQQHNGWLEEQMVSLATGETCLLYTSRCV